MTPAGILLAGLSGQGVEEAARLLCAAGLASGLEARLAADRPAAMRGASVRCQVRLSPGELRSPFVPEGEADLLLSLDRLEALRWVHEVRAGGLVVVAGRTAPTPRMRLGLEEPPAGVLERLKARVPRSFEVPEEELAEEPGLRACAAGVLLGLVSPLLPVAAGAWEEALHGLLGGEDLAAWRRALGRGRALFARLPEALRRSPEPRAA